MRHRIYATVSGCKRLLIVLRSAALAECAERDAANVRTEDDALALVRYYSEAQMHAADTDSAHVQAVIGNRDPGRYDRRRLARRGEKPPNWSDE